jgi:hypothetical protein
MAFTDYFDNPINVGDEIVYPAYYGSSAQLNRVTVDTIVPLIPHPDANKNTLVRADHASKRSPNELTQFKSTIGWGQDAEPLPDEHRFVLVVRELLTYGPKAGQYGPRRSVTNIHNVIVVPKEV